jgi:hypothetical protein
MTEIERYLPFLFPIFFIGLWCFILWIFSFVSGWRRLVKRFHYSSDFLGDFIRFQSARMNLVNFKNVLHLGLCRQGLYLKQMVLFQLFHKPILIPWEEIIAQPFQRALYQGYQLQFRSVPGVRLELYRGTFLRILDYLERHTDFKLDY